MNLHLLCSDFVRTVWQHRARPLRNPRISFRGAGITTMELLIVLTVLSILLTLAVPVLGEIIQRNRLAADASLFTLDLAFARSEAIKRRQAVTVCTSANGQTCANTEDWSGGWIIFSDPAGDAVLDATPEDCPPTLTIAQDCLLRVRESLSDGDVLRNTTTMSHIIFGPEGTLANVANETEFLLCAPQQTLSRESEFQIRVGVTGLTTRRTLSCP